MRNLLFFALLLQGAYATSGSRDITIGYPAYGGTGCPQGSASASVTDDGSALTILFDQYAAEAGGTSGQAFNRKTCNIAIPLHIPQGYSVSVVQVDYRGYNELPRGASSTFNVEYFLAGSRGPRYSKTFWGATSDEFLVSNRLAASAMIWSKCGEDVLLRTNSSVIVRTNDYMEQAMSQVDSADVKAGIVYLFQWKTCR